MKAWLLVLGLATLLILSMLSISILAFDDTLSKKIRAQAEISINVYIEKLTSKAFNGTLSLVDKTILNVSLLTGIVYSRINYPEASALLYHYVYGDGSDLELSSDYFRKSHYLSKKITTLGLGDHGPISLRQKQDLRLSLALNPYYLKITKSNVRLFHPNIAFASLEESDRTFTVVPVGKMQLKVYDNLISAMNPNPFYTYAEWSRSF